MSEITNNTGISKAVDRKPSKLQLLKSLVGNIKKLDELKLANPQELKTIREITTRLKTEVIGEL